MANERKNDDIERLLDAMDNFKKGDENAFDGMTIHLDNDDKSKCMDEDN